jgi:ADP-ribose pyrophosphatase YjhB (NUDIX family)
MMDYVTYIRGMVGQKKIFLNAAACILVNEHNQILLQLRGDDHYWGLPGGIMELGETMETTCRREVLEETGLIVEDLKFLGVFHNTNKRWPNGDVAHIICHVFVARQAQGDLVIDHQETLDLQYFDKDDLPMIDAVDHRQAIERFFGMEEPDS